MGTVSKEIADRIVAGEFESDKIVKIVEYTNAFDGGKAYGCIAEGEDLNRYSPSHFIRNPRVYWEKK